MGNDNVKKLLLSIGDRVKQEREEMGLTQEQFADKYGYARTTLAKLEAGLRDFKSTEIITLAEQLNVSCDYLLGRTDIKYSDIAEIKIAEKLGLTKTSITVLEHIKKNKQDDVEFTLTDLVNYFGEGTDDIWLSIDALIKIPKYKKTTELTDLECYYIGSLCKKIFRLIDNLRDKIEKDKQKKEKFRILRERREESLREIISKGGDNNVKHNETDE